MFIVELLTHSFTAVLGNWVVVEVVGRGGGPPIQKMLPITLKIFNLIFIFNYVHVRF